MTYSKLWIDGSIETYDAIEPIEDMINPVECRHCLSIYDLTNVKVNHRFQDCSQMIEDGNLFLILEK